MFFGAKGGEVESCIVMFFLAKDEQRFGHFLVHARFRNLMCGACIVCVSHCTLIGIPGLYGQTTTHMDSSSASRRVVGASMDLPRNLGPRTATCLRLLFGKASEAQPLSFI